MIAAALVLFVLAVVLMGTTVLAAGGVVKRNAFVGIRVHYFVLSQESWEAGHLAALLPVTVGGLIAIAGGIVALTRPGSGGLVVVAFILLFALVAWGILRGDRAALDAIAAGAGDDTGTDSDASK